MKALIHEFIKSDTGTQTGSTYPVEDLSTELERLDRTGAIFNVVSSAPDPEIEGLQVWINFYI